MELVREDHLPHAVQFALRVSGSLFSGQLCQNGEEFQLHHRILALTVGAFVSCHGGVGSAMVLKVELAYPLRQSLVVLHALPELVEILTGKGLTDFRNALDAFVHTTGHFHHISGRTAAAVAVTEAYENIVVDILILIAVPAAHDSIRMKHAVISGEEAGLGLTDSQGRDQMGKDPASVDSLPHEAVIRVFVELVPGKLRGHKILDATFFHNLGKSCAVAEYVRQPEDLVLHVKLFFEKSLSELELANQ